MFLFGVCLFCFSVVVVVVVVVVLGGSLPHVYASRTHAWRHRLRQDGNANGHVSADFRR